MEVERVFRGSRMQRGYGLGGFLTSMFRRAIPLLKSGGKYILKKAVRTGMNSMRDIANDIEPRTAVKRSIAEVSDEMFDDVKRKIHRKMTGGGRRKKKVKRKAPKKKRGKKKFRNKKKRTVKRTKKKKNNKNKKKRRMHT